MKSLEGVLEEFARQIWEDKEETTASELIAEFTSQIQSVIKGYFKCPHCSIYFPISIKDIKSEKKSYYNKIISFIKN